MRLQMIALAASVLAATACNDATAPVSVAGHRIRAQLVPPASPVASAQVSAGSNATCALKTAGTVVCWGGNYDQAVVPSGLASVAQVSTGFGYAPCAVKTDGTVVCWGHNDGGDGIVPTGLTSVAQLANGFTPCALKTDGTMVCWGDNTYGAATPPVGLASIVQASEGFFHVCALKTDATVVCWGGQGYPGPGLTLGQATVPSGLGPVTQVSAGSYHTCALKTDGTVVCWGADNSGYDLGQVDVPAGLASVAQVSAGGFHTCALKTDGTVVCWGYAGNGAAAPPVGLSSVAQVSAGYSQTCALKTDGTVVCWGDNTYGESTVPAGLNLITAAPQSISFTSTAPSPAYRTDTYAVSAAATSGLAVTFSTSTPTKCGVSGNTVTFTAVGTCIVTADQAGNAAYLAAPEQTQSITVIRRLSQTISFTSIAPSSPYAGTTYAVSATATSGLPVTFRTSTPDKCSVSGATVSLDAGGTCIVAAEQAGDSTYRRAAKQTQSIAIVKQPQTITVTSTAPSPVYVGSTYTIMATATSGLAVSFKTSSPGKCTVAGGTVTFAGAGTCTLAAEQAGNVAYLAAPEQTQAITVVKQTQAISITSTAPSQAYPNGTYDVSATATSGLLVTFSSSTPGKCSISGGTVTFTAVGTCVVAVEQGGDAAYLAAPKQTQSITVVQQP